ncbi:hypothetical protein PHISP_03555 [Aspergillus sp. HF37]|nr:hypothetical protein PHISP_03555 [Aspergillus sp. HF37]
MSNPQGNAVGFLISERPPARENGRCNVDGILGLQVLIAESLEIAIPIIPIPDSGSFLSSIQEYMASLVVLPVLRPGLSDAVALLARTTRSRYFKFTEADISALGELFPSLRAMSRAVRTEGWRQMLRAYFGDALGTEMIRYWEEDEH